MEGSAASRPFVFIVLFSLFIVNGKLYFYSLEKKPYKP